MVDYFDTAQMSSALASLTARVTGKAGEVSLYPVLKKATSSNEQPTPGYINQVSSFLSSTFLAVLDKFKSPKYHL